MEILPSFDCPPILEKIMKACWKQDPNERPDFKQILAMFKELKD